jgi:F-type H+-transporting ATPase subunit O
MFECYQEIHNVSFENVSHLRIIARGLSTSSGRLALVQPPMQVYGTEGRYATALYSAASKKNVLDAVEKDLASFNTTLKKDPRLGDFLADPSIKKALKAEGLAGVCDKLKMNELSKNMFLAMAENGRYSFMSAAVLSFSTIMAAHRGEVVCEVTTAKVWIS